ncbi:enoyl-CoA hydratase/carnithine racemase [Paraburkholderia sp. BL27I4N3]|uniref:enoyl-CoA hydratase/isomerase family protein n=1 Tax=Paraburkholderia sp. BL27I4N3 TaxID=1938805 RepID=UPI000E22638A|nr:enoyl-CoA hydratase-related protein [Paraburkholderia sp. BL27I4N3]REE07403.1 enoyl-CoA hydratase/carnithine racemase [Paraburkholderia sp. BL27I4N3]
MNNEQVLCEVHDGVATLLLNNPPLNVVTLGLTRALGAALDSLAANDAVRAVIVTGTGERAFCAGSDINEFHELMAPGQVVPKKLGRQNEVFSQLDDFPKPTIAALNGLAYGGGLEIAVCCDLLIAEEQVNLCLPEIKLGVFPSSGGTVRVTRRIGEGRAKDMMYFGEPIDAATALAWGLVNRVVPRGEALRVARQMAATLCERPPLALSLCKSVIDRSFDLPLHEVIQHSLQASDKAFSSAECAEGVRAFRAREAPNFRR